MPHIYKSEEEAIEFIKIGVDFKNIRFDYFRDNKKVILEALIHQGTEILQSISKHLRDDKQFMIESINHDGGSLEFASQRLKNDFEVVLKSCQKNESFIIYASQEIKKICEDEIPSKALQSFILNRDLHIELSQKENKIFDKKNKI